MYHKFNLGGRAIERWLNQEDLSKGGPVFKAIMLILSQARIKLEYTAPLPWPSGMKDMIYFHVRGQNFIQPIKNLQPKVKVQNQQKVLLGRR